MTAAPRLFDPSAAVRASARATDPRTSHEAAESFDEATLNREQQRVLDALRLLAASGQPTTAGRVTRLLGDRQRNCVSRRLTDLAERGVVRDSGRTFREDRKGARSEICWEVR